MGMMKRFVDEVYAVLEDVPDYVDMDYTESADLGIEIATDLFDEKVFADHPAFRDKVLQLAKVRGLKVPPQEPTDLYPEDDPRMDR